MSVFVTVAVLVFGSLAFVGAVTTAWVLDSRSYRGVHRR